MLTRILFFQFWRVVKLDEILKRPDEMYCVNCGSLISEKAIICLKCGIQVNELNISPDKKSRISNVDFSKSSGMSIASMILGIVSVALSLIPFPFFLVFLWLFIPMIIIAIVLGIVDLVKIKNKESSPLGKPKDITGIVLGALSIVSCFGFFR